MQPKPPQASELLQLQLFQSRLDSQLNPDHPPRLLARHVRRLADLIDWDRFDDAYAPLYCEDNGAPALPTRLMVGLEYLKYAYNLSDVELVMRWIALKIFTGRTGSIFAVARQFKRLQRCIQNLKNWLGHVLRDIERNRKNRAFSVNFEMLIDTSKKLLLQERNTPKKIYSLHELGVQCIGKGKDRIRYELLRWWHKFGNKASVVMTNRRNWIVNVEDCANNPYDGHTLAASIAGAEKITKLEVTEANVDKGYRGHDYKGTAVIRLAGTSNAKLSVSERKRKRRRSAIEPVIGHLKSDHRLGRCFLLGRIGDALNVIGSAAGFNVRKLLRLLGRGIFSHAPTGFAHALREIFFQVQATCKILGRFVSATMKYLAPCHQARRKPGGFFVTKNSI